jgi:sialic acid synthase SpsE
MIVSTGMGTLDEVAEAVETIRAAGNDDITVLHCVSNYPAPPESVNLRAMAAMHSAWRASTFRHCSGGSCTGTLVSASTSVASLSAAAQS